jgi:SAM-dependent methyltransferase
MASEPPLPGGDGGSNELRDVYEAQYAAEGDDARRYGAWRELCAAGKADHVAELVRALPQPPRTIAEVGCGDGVLLTQLARRGMGERRDGFDISERAASFAATRPEVDSAQRFDGHTLPVPNASYDLGILSHVLEHVPDPLQLLRETARVARAVIVEVPLEDNLSASRASAQAGRDAIGHLHRFSRAGISQMAVSAGLRVDADLADPLPLVVHSFFATTPAAHAKSVLKASTRRALFTIAPALAERTFTLHYAALCLPRQP